MTPQAGEEDGMGKLSREEEAAIRERVRVERSEHKRRDEQEAMLRVVVPMGIIVAVTAVLALVGAFR